ncbi:LysO family transporter [uncultured Shewanella sp.]|uniref:LysO family transporter n=1 Tax=uncultured Shewanella sp. TaxID=173975 RepID=UPI0026276056|nr:LysO family transporter [uncultured Shewanella sp.]
MSAELGSVYGAIALMTDLFRELLAIILLYLLGQQFSRECIAAGGATTLDSTLPIVKQTCSSEQLSTALVSGLILTLLAPILMTLFLSL